MEKKKIGILGGSFDPIHNGHLAIAKSAYRDFGLDEVWFIPAGHSPNKNETEMTPAVMRAEMTAIAIEEIPYFKLSKIELESKETSYTYLTLERLKNQYPEYDFYFIMGADSLDYFDQWYKPEIICSLAHILVAVRDELDQSAIVNKIAEIKNLFEARISLLSVGKVAVASSKIREAVKMQLDIEDMVPTDVAEYIRQKHLYEN